jgi:hypothetical protein
MASDETKRKRLVDFLERRAFEPVLRASPDRYESDAQKEKLADVQRSTESEKRRFREDYHSAQEVRDNYLSDLRSSTGKKKTSELEALGLPSLPSLKDDFLAYCDELGVSRA